MKLVNKTSLFGLVAISISLAGLCACNGGAPEKNSIELDKKVSQITPVLEVSPVVGRRLSRDTELPGELMAYQDVPLYAKVPGFIQWIGVDRGSRVHKGETLIRVSAPELDAKCAEAIAHVDKARSSLLQAESKLESAKANVREGQAREEGDNNTYLRLKKAATNPGVISENELDVAGKTVEGDKEHVKSLTQAVAAAKSDVCAAQSDLSAAKQSLLAVQDMQSYLTVKAPFEGIVVSRNVHEGSLVSPNDTPMVRLQQLSTLRLVVPVPEIAVAGIQPGRQIPFTVPAFPDKTFYGSIARLGHALDQKTRTMPVEIDVANADGKLEPGMYPQVHWTVERTYDTTFVPASAVGHSLSKTYVLIVENGVVRVATVSVGQTMGDQVEVFGPLKSGDQVASKAAEDIKSGTHVEAKLASASEVVGEKTH